MCPELLLSLVVTQEISRCSRAPEMECIEYWKVKGQAAAAESPASTYPFGRSVCDGWLINRYRKP
jgi:hypothetical protein